LSETANVTIKIYDASSTLVRTLLNALSRNSGNRSEVWNGNNDSVTAVADGIYTYKIDASDAAGNAAVQQTGTVTVDTLPPVAPAMPDLTTDDGCNTTDNATTVTTPTFV